jgi:hypothetical protein
VRWSATIRFSARYHGHPPGGCRPDHEHSPKKTLAASYLLRNVGVHRAYACLPGADTLGLQRSSCSLCSSCACAFRILSPQVIEMRREHSSCVLHERLFSQRLQSSTSVQTHTSASTPSRPSIIGACRRARDLAHHDGHEEKGESGISGRYR